MRKETWRLQYILHMVYFESFCYVMYYIVSEICIGGHFLEECFYCYSQRIKSAVANKSLIPYNLIKRALYFFCVEDCYLLTWNVAHILSNLKTFKEATKHVECDVIFFTEVIIYQHFQQVTYHLLVFVRLQTLVVYFLCFLAFCEFQCHFYKKTFVLTFVMKYYTSFWFEGG